MPASDEGNEGACSALCRESTDEGEHVATVESMINVLGEFFSLNFENPEYQALFDSNDIGFPLSYHIWRGLAAPTDRTSEYLTDTWIEFCSLFGANPLDDYVNLADFLES